MPGDPNPVVVPGQQEHAPPNGSDGDLGRQEHTQIPSDISGAGRRVSIIAWSFMLFTSIVFGNTSSTMTNFFCSAVSVYLLAGYISEPLVLVDLLTMLVAVGVSSHKIYSGANKIVFVFHLSTILAIGGATLFLTVIRRSRLVGQNTTTSDIFVPALKNNGGIFLIAMTLFSRLLFDNAITPMGPGFTANALYGLQEAIFAASFSYIIASLWLELTGTRVGNPMRWASYVNLDGIAFATLILRLIGSALLIVYTIVNMMILPGMSLVEGIPSVMVTALVIYNHS